MSDARPKGEPVRNWTPPPKPGPAVLSGRFCRLEQLDAERHAAMLFNSFNGHSELWDYLPYGPFQSASQYHRWVRETVADKGHQYYAIRAGAGKPALGVASFLRINPEAGSIEVGSICMSPKLQRSPIATEAMYLMMKWAFESGYRRYEWKCNALNMPSRRAAQRLGFGYEGVFRQAMVVKGRNRDTAWFAAIDKEWPALQSAFEAWLHPSNFDESGQQIERLSDLTALVRVAADPAL